ncbi:MAG: alpha/beta hydrolase, partial [Halanaerobium sp.]
MQSRKHRLEMAIFMILIVLLIGSGSIMADTAEDQIEMSYTVDTKVWDVINDPTFEGYGRLIFPADRRIDKSMTLSEVDRLLTWYNNVNPDCTVEIVNYMKSKAEAGKQIFYDIYSDEEKAADPAKEN